MCTANIQDQLSAYMNSGQKKDDKKPRPIKNAADVPLGDGLADQAKTSILTRRERIRRAVEGT